MLSTARMVFVKHRQGFVFPAQVNANVVDGQFVAALQKCDTTDEFLWFYRKSHSVTAASEGSLALLGVRCLCVCVCVCVAILIMCVCVCCA